MPMLPRSVSFVCVFMVLQSNQALREGNPVLFVSTEASVQSVVVRCMRPHYMLMRGWVWAVCDTLQLCKHCALAIVNDRRRRGRLFANSECRTS